MNSKFLYELPIELPNEGCTFIYTKNSTVVAAEIKRADQFVSTLAGFIMLAQSAGYRLIPPEGKQV